MENYINTIIQTKKNGNTELDIQNRRLDEYPEMVSQLTELKTLLLGNYKVIDNSILHLGGEYWWETTIDDNCIEFLPESIASLKNIEVLDLNQLGLEKLPDAIGELTNLKELKLRNNLLMALPDSFKKLQNLEILDISFNLFENFPIEILGCKNLKSLNIGSNRLSSIPPEIKELQQLESFDCSNFDRNRTSHEVIEKYELHANQITELPESMAALKKLNGRNVNVKRNPMEHAFKWFLRLQAPLSLWYENQTDMRTAFKENEEID